MVDKSSLSWGDVRQFITDALLFSAGSVCLIFGIIYLIGGNAVAAGTGLTAGVVLLLSSSIERFEVLKGLGMEARVRKLDATIVQASATLAQLRELAEISSESLISLNSKTGRYSSPPSFIEAYDTVQRVQKNLRNLGSEEEIIFKIMEPWVFTTTFDLVSHLLTQIKHQHQLLLQNCDQKIQSHPQPILSDDPQFTALIDERLKFGSFVSEHIGDINDWPLGTHSNKLRFIIDHIPILHESERQTLRLLIDPWLPRLDYLVAHYDLSDKKNWIEILDR